jgi:hypothetical protein
MGAQSHIPSARPSTHPSVRLIHHKIAFVVLKPPAIVQSGGDLILKIQVGRAVLCPPQIRETARTE